MVARKIVKKETKKVAPKLAKVEEQKRVEPKVVQKNPRRNPVEAQIKPENPNKKKYFTIEEDAIIINAFQNLHFGQTKTQVINEISKKIEKSVESIKNRIKRYINKFSSNDVK